MVGWDAGGEPFGCGRSVGVHSVEAELILEDVTKQLSEQGHQTNARFDGIERAIADLRRDTNARFDSLERSIENLRRDINARLDSLTRWLVGVQVVSFLVMGGLLVSILLKLK